MPDIYYEKALRKADEYRNRPAPFILGIESSCDETAAAIASPV